MFNIATREGQKIIQELYDKGKSVYSFSKVECINNCLYEAYRTYILHDKDKAQNIYSVLGSSVHDVLEQITNNQATEEDLLPAIQKDLDELDMLGIEFPKGRDGADTIRLGWIADMEHFCKTYKAPKGDFKTEEFFLYTTPGGNYIQGYIDLKKLMSDHVNIYDYKTSSLYKGEDIKSHGRQLILYALGTEELGEKVKEVAWIFLKYCEVKYRGKKTSRSKEETDISKVIERKNLIKELEPVITTKLEKLGMDEVDVEIAILNAKKTNTIPEEVADQFKVIPYVMKYELSDETKEDTCNYVDSTIAMWEKLGGKEHPEDYPHRDFHRTQKNGKVVEDIFYCTSLCSYKNTCPHIKKFLEIKENNKSEFDDLF